MKTSISEKAKIGVLSVGHREYWDWGQFPHLKQDLMAMGKEIADYVATLGNEVVWEFVDRREQAYEAGLRMRAAQIDVLFLHITGYCASGRYIQGALAVDCPIVIVASQKWRDTSGKIDHIADDTNSDGGNCGFPEASNALLRCGKKAAGLVFAEHMSEKFKNNLAEWARAADAMHAFKGVAFGYMGHSYDGMMDMNFDPTAITKVTGAYVQMVEMCELVKYIQENTDEEIEAKLKQIKDVFVLKDQSYDPMTKDLDPAELRWAATVAVGLDKLIQNNNLSGLAYYYMGENDSIYERAAASLMIGNSLMTTDGISMAGEGDMKTCVAMYLTSALGCGGSFAELCGCCLDYDQVCCGHDGPHDIRICEGQPWVRSLNFNHGKKGRGVGVEFRLKNGPISMVGLTHDANCNFKLVVAEGEAVPGWISQTGNSFTRVDFGMDASDFTCKWTATGVTHHAAMAIGHVYSLVEKVGKLMNIPVEKVC